jgi:monovalent cation:H+ antiporter, CPA1 family
MAISLAISIALLAGGLLGIPGARHQAAHILNGLDFNQVLLHGMLAFMLFAGAQSLNLNDLKHEKAPVVLLATVSVVVSTLVVGLATYLLLQLIGIHATLLNALLFGALVSPTDPIAVIGIMKTARAPKSLETQIAGESLFNDGIGVVVFLVILELAGGDLAVSPLHLVTLFFEEAAGGALFGLATGYVVYQMLKANRQLRS